MPIDEWPGDAELHRLFHDSAAPPSTIDAARVIRRSKRRRLPAQIGAGSAVTLAVAGIGIASINGIRLPSMVGTAETASDTLSGESLQPANGGAPWSTQGGACAMPAPSVEFSQSALRVSTEFPDGRVGDSIAGSVVLTNTTTAAFSGWVTAPVVYVMSDGVAVAHNDDFASAAMRLELAPGESRSIVASVDAVHCGHVSDVLRAGSALEPGEYDLLAIVTVTSDGGDQAPVSSDFGSPAMISSVPITVTLD